MINRYHGANPSITNIQELYGRADVFSLLDDHIRNRRSVVVMGVEGVGKSSLLNCYFNQDYRKRMALEQRILIRVTDFPTDRDTDGVYQYLAEGVLSAIDSLAQAETEAVYRNLREKCIQKMNECKDSASRFQQVCEKIQEDNYNIMLVIDGFERFVSSPNVKMEHHDLMNNLIAKNLSFVVATDYDFNQDSLPPKVSGSFLLMKFSGNEIRLKGLSEDEVGKLIYPEDFTPDELHQLWILSAGIPSIFRRAAEHTYAQKVNGEIDWKTVLQETYADVSSLLARWCKLLSKDQIRVLKTLAGSDSLVGKAFEEETLKTAAQALVNRGLLANPIESGTMRAISGLFKFNTPLFKKYCKDHDLDNSADSTNTSVEISDDQLLEWYQNWAKENGYPNPVSFTDSLTDALLGHYMLTRASFESYSDVVQRFIHIGILVDQTLINVHMDDHSPAFIEFAKALEAHLSLTVLPVMRLIDPDYVIKKDRDPSKSLRLENVDHLTLGQILTTLSSGYRFASFTEKAGSFSSSRLNNLFPTTWWEKIKNELSKVGAVTIRNHIAHSDFVSAEQGEALLRTMFWGDKSLFNRCQYLHDEAKARGLFD